MVAINSRRGLCAGRAELTRYLEQMAHLLKLGRLEALSKQAEALALLAGRDQRADLVRLAARLLGAAERADVLGCVQALVSVAQAIDATTD